MDTNLVETILDLSRLQLLDELETILRNRPRSLHDTQNLGGNGGFAYISWLPSDAVNEKLGAQPTHVATSREVVTKQENLLFQIQSCASWYAG